MATLENRQFHVEGAHDYDRRLPPRWVVSHVLRCPLLPTVMLLGSVANTALMSIPAVLIGMAFDEVISPMPDLGRLGLLVLLVLVTGLGRGALQLASSWTLVVLAERLERDTREELAICLLGKSQTFHRRQQVGDVMARATQDVRQMGFMLSPGIWLIMVSTLGMTIPLLFAISFAFLLREFMRRLGPDSARMRAESGRLNAGLAEAISGVEVVNGYAQAEAERRRFVENAAAYRDSSVLQGLVQGRNLPGLVLGLIVGLAFGHAVLLYRAGTNRLGEFSLVVPAGERLAIVGHTGAGTSSLARLIARFYEFQGGEILVDSRDVRTFDLAQNRHLLGLVPQVPFLFAGTVARSIRYGRPDAADAEVAAVARQIDGGEWVDDLPNGLESEVGERGNRLSLGQRQLVALRRVLLQDPAILILDEATASVDPLIEAQNQKGLEVVMARRTSIVIAHRLSTVRHADRIFVLDKGQIVDNGAHDALLGRGGHNATIYLAYFRHQSLGYVEAAGGIR